MIPAIRSESALSAKAVTLCTNSVFTVTLVAILRNKTHRIDWHLCLLRNEPWQGHANDTSVKPVQDACPPLDWTAD